MPDNASASPIRVFKNPKIRDWGIEHDEGNFFCTTAEAIAITHLDKYVEYGECNGSLVMRRRECPLSD